MTALRTLAEALAGLAVRDEGLREAARQRVFDALGALAVGRATDEGRVLARLSDTGRAAMVRLAVGATRATEIDDIHLPSCVTAGSVVVPAAAVLAARAGPCRDEDFFAAVVAGYEVALRFGTALDGANALYRGVWPTLAVAPLAAAAIASRLKSLDTATTTSALAIALGRTTWINPGRGGPVPARGYTLGAAAAEGVAAAEAAAAGFGGDAGLLDRLGGAIGFDPAALAAPLGTTWLIGDVDTKPFPTARQSMAVVAAFQALGPLPHPPAEIEGISVGVPAPVRAMIGAPTLPQNRLASMISAPYQLALAALAPERLHDVVRTALPADDAIRAFMAKVTLHDEAELTARFPAQWGATLRLRWASGATAETTVLDPPGAARAGRLGWGALADKYRRILAASGLAAGAALDRLQADCQSLGTPRSRGTTGLLDAALALE